jgi:SAM-dependent methyltransferase
MKMSDTARAFDGVAAEYHASNMENPILLHMRQQVLSVLRRNVRAGGRLLDLGCGPGTDHAALVREGYRITALDASPEMVREATRRSATMSDANRPTIYCQPIERVRELELEPFDAAFSNFGPLNCVPDLADAAGQIRDTLKPGGVLVASVIGRICPWEIALYLSRGEVARALVRFRTGAVGVPLKDGTIWTQYLTPKRFVRTFTASGFSVRERRGLGVVAPPPYLTGFAARHPGLVSRLLDWDESVGRWRGFRDAGDHFLVVMERR